MNGDLRKRLPRKVLIGALRTFAIACGAFVSSRRWLLAALMITGVLLALISFVRPSPRHSISAPGEPDILFDEVKNYPLGTKLADSRFRPDLGDKPSPFNGDSKPAARLPKSPADGLAWEDGHRAAQSMPLSRRLGAVRSRAARRLAHGNDRIDCRDPLERERGTTASTRTSTRSSVEIGQPRPIGRFLFQRMVIAMYEQYWNLDCRPFEGHFSPAFFFDSETHLAARLKLRYMIDHRLGTAALCGGIGTGKTAVAACLHHELSESCGPIAHLVFPKMPAAAFLAYVASKLGAPESPADARHGIDRTLVRIEAKLREASEQGKHPVMIVDDAHLIDDVRVFECLQLLLNFQQDPACAFSLLFVGGLNLLGKLERIPQLNDRIAVRSFVEPLSHDDTIGYVAHRLHVAGAKRRSSTRARSKPCTSVREASPAASIVWPIWR